ncbi:hypothetical protein GUJ93_ZPchr0010g10083 [Zizania palustris]|uniref:Aquaporin n=1 Tax=Zizania palustris TaxID=103762 RepID=A0A8J5WA88_ZIZPA|nr:hypothetical protein GUJ93_ZPchr0010g10083 [Zizania palustris]
MSESERESDLVSEESEEEIEYKAGAPPAPIIDMQEFRHWTLYRALISEFVATLLFLYITVASVIGYKVQSSADPCDGVGVINGLAWASGGMIFVLVYCNTTISGGHINPAVTFGMMLTRKITVPRCVLYMAAQCLGAIVGTAIVKGTMDQHAYDSNGGGANVVASGYSRGAALAAEIIGTFILVFIVFYSIDPKMRAMDSTIPLLAPLPMGFAVFAVQLATIPITGAGINPARSLGAAVIYNHSNAWDDHWIFWVGPLVGAAAAAVYYHFNPKDAIDDAMDKFEPNPTN